MENVLSTTPARANRKHDSNHKESEGNEGHKEE
jgi:hypothetical protein